MSQHLATGEAQLRKIAAMVTDLNPKKVWRIEIKLYQTRRTMSQNKLYWAILTAMAEETGHTKDEMHDAMKTKFLPQSVVSLADEDIYIPASSRTLEKQVFADYIDKVCSFAATELGLTV